MNTENLTKGEEFIVNWQYHLAGDFFTALSQAISRADVGNLRKLALGFPEEVAAYRAFSYFDDWWPNLQKKIGMDDLKERINKLS